MVTCGAHDGMLLAISDLHVEAPENRSFVAQLRPRSDSDWLIVCGDVGESTVDIEWAFGCLANEFSRVIWVPGNHELWTPPDDPCQLRGEERYLYLVDRCRALGIDTPEDPFPIWTGDEGPVVVAPILTLYDYSFVPDRPVAEADVMCSDEMLLSPHPYPSIGAWCRKRVEQTEARLGRATADHPCVLVGHFPLLRALTERLIYPDFALWCGTVLTADWHKRFNARAVVYGHLHIPSVATYDGVPFHEVSVGYPRERHRYGRPRPSPRRILGAAERAAR